MSNDNVESIGIIDDTGVRKNVMDILELLRTDSLIAIALVWKTKDDRVRTFHNGDDDLLKGLMFQALYDLSDKGDVEYIDYEKRLGEEDNNEAYTDHKTGDSSEE